MKVAGRTAEKPELILVNINMLTINAVTPNAGKKMLRILPSLEQARKRRISPRSELNAVRTMAIIETK